MKPMGKARRRTPRAVRVLLIMALPVVGAARAASDVGPTVASVLDSAQGASRAVTSAAATWSGDAQASAAAAVAAIAARSQDVRTAAAGKTAAAVASLPDKVRPQAQRLALVSRSVTALLAHPGACLFQDLDLVVAGLKTATTTLRAPVSAPEADAPTLAQFLFDGHQQVALVPREGGAFTLSGSKLWSEPTLTPDVKVQSDGAAIATLTPQRGANADEIKVTLGKELVAQNAGKCVLVTVTPYATSHVLLMSRGPKKLAELALPMCFPAAVERSFVMTASLTGGAGTKSGTSGPVPLALPATRMCANVPREAGNAARTFSLTIAPAIGSGKPMPPIYTGTPKAAADLSIFSFEEPAGPYLVHVSYNPTLMGMSQICADVSAIQACSW